MTATRQRTAYSEADCAECYRYIAQDEPIWFADGSKYCVTCAVKKGIDCPQCHGTKKPEFEVCWNCKQDAGGGTKKVALL